MSDKKPTTGPPAMTYHHNTRILCDTCNTASNHHTVTAAFDDKWRFDLISGGTHE